MELFEVQKQIYHQLPSEGDKELTNSRLVQKFDNLDDYCPSDGEFTIISKWLHDL
jgi:hypothetical protein